MKPTLKLGIALFAASLAACAVARPVTLPTGDTGQVVECDGALISWGTCYIKAGQVCPRGYDVLMVNGEAQPFLVSSGSLSSSAGSASGSYGTVAGDSMQRTLMIRCH